jgi:hypothetical protein
VSRSNSPKRRHHRKVETKILTCAESSKRCYGSRKQALAALNDVRSRPSAYTTLPTRVYRCGFCRRWHLTKSAA